MAPSLPRIRNRAGVIGTANQQVNCGDSSAIPKFAQGAAEPAKVLLALGVFWFGRSIWVPISLQFIGKRTVRDVVDAYGSRTDASLRPRFERAGLRYAPKRIAFLCFKEERRLELWGQDNGPWVFVTEFGIKAASGKPGPKLEEGDGQIPEGIYQIEGLNPNSSYHLSLKLNYPNDFDVAHAKTDGRTRLGGDIFIHGNTGSVGCLAMGDEVAELLFVLVSRVGKDNVRVIVAPRDFRQRPTDPPTATAPSWVPELYAGIASELGNFRKSATR